jgi:hypothetical protein
MCNLNDLFAVPAPLHLVVAFYITDDGLIAGTDVPPGVELVVREEWLGTTATNTAAKQEMRGTSPYPSAFRT